MEEKMIQEKFMKGYDCSQVVLEYYAEKLGVSRELANKAAACFGGGMMMGEVCGAFTGALMVIGLKYGHYDEENLLEQKNIMAEKYAEFKSRYFEKYNSVNCKELLGYDITIPEQMEEALSSGRMMSFCPEVVRNVCEILEDFI